MCPHNLKQKRVYALPTPLPPPPYHLTVSPRAQTQDDHSSEMQTTQLKVTGALKHFAPERHIPPTTPSRSTGFSECKSQTGPQHLTRHARHPGTRRPGFLSSARPNQGSRIQDPTVPQRVESGFICLPSRTGALETRGSGRAFPAGHAGRRESEQVALTSQHLRLPSPHSPPCSRAHVSPPGAPSDTHPHTGGRASADPHFPSTPPLLVAPFATVCRPELH